MPLGGQAEQLTFGDQDMGCGKGCKRSRDKIEPIFGDVASRTVPCNYFLGLYFLLRLDSTSIMVPGPCRVGSRFEDRATSGRVFEIASKL